MSPGDGIQSELEEGWLRPDPEARTIASAAFGSLRFEKGTRPLDIAVRAKHTRVVELLSHR